MTLAILIAGCGGDSEPGAQEAVYSYFPKEFEGQDIIRTSDIDIYIGDSLYEYINGGAELYHAYDFIRVLTASYQMGEEEVIYDIYEFQDPEKSYGLYTMLRPDYIETLDLGVQGFSAGSAVDFVKGQYLVRLTGFTYTDEFAKKLVSFAHAIDGIVEGITDRPQKFNLFLEESKLQAGDKIIAESYLGHDFLTHIYSQDYQLDDDTVTLFLSQDPNQAKMAGFKSVEVSEEVGETDVPDLGTEDIFISYDSFHGHILAVADHGILKGMTGYEPGHLEFFKSWIVATE